MARQNKKAPKAKVKRELDCLEALNLRRIGLSYTQIAKRIGCSTAWAQKLVVTALAETVRERNLATADLIQIDLERLDAALLAIWPGVVNGDVSKIDRLLRILQRRARMLGLDAPKKIEASGPDGGPIEVGLGVDETRRQIAQILEKYCDKANK